MATLILSSGNKVRVSENYTDLKSKVFMSAGGFMEFKAIVTITPADQDLSDYTIEEPVSINLAHIEQMF